MYPLIESTKKSEQVSEVPKAKKVSKNKRGASYASRTRGLIQIGGLVGKSGLTNMFGIQNGDDLQSEENIEKAAILLGFLSETCDNIDDVFLEKHRLWKSRGLTMLRDKKGNE